MDMHKKGVFAVIGPTPGNSPLFESFADTGYSARALFIRAANIRWSRAEELGYRIIEFVAQEG